MHGYRIHHWDGHLVWDELMLPSPEPGEARVRVSACGIGRTVVAYTEGSLSRDPALLPRVPGHEFAGMVDAVGNVETDGHLIGRQVLAYFSLFCGDCGPCRSGQEPRCEKLAGRIGVHRDGGYAPVAVLPVANLLPAPPGVDPVAATVIADAVATPVHIARRVGIEADDRVVVIGAGGGVGMHMVQVAAGRGPAVIGLDRGSEKVAAVGRYVAAVEVGERFPRAARLFGDRGPTVVVDLAGTQDTLRWAVDGLDPGGRLAVLASSDRLDVVVPSRRLVLRELAVLGSLYATRAEVMEAAELVVSGVVEPVVSEVVDPTGVPALHARIRSGDVVGRAAVAWPQERL